MMRGALRALIVLIPVILLAAVLARVLSLSGDGAPANLLAPMLHMWTPAEQGEDLAVFSTWSGIPIVAMFALVAFRPSVGAGVVVYAVVAGVLWAGVTFLASRLASQTDSGWSALATVVLVVVAACTPAPTVVLPPSLRRACDLVSGASGGLAVLGLLMSLTTLVPLLLWARDATLLWTVAAVPYTWPAIAGAAFAFLTGANLIIGDGVGFVEVSVSFVVRDSSLGIPLIVILGVIAGLISLVVRPFMYRTAVDEGPIRAIFVSVAGLIAVAGAYVVASEAVVRVGALSVAASSPSLWAVVATMGTVAIIGAIRITRSRTRAISESGSSATAEHEVRDEVDSIQDSG